MEPLILKVQADTQGIPESFNRIVQSQEGMNISSRKASGALKGLVEDLARARDGADVASAVLGASAKFLGHRWPPLGWLLLERQSLIPSKKSQRLSRKPRTRSPRLLLKSKSQVLM